MRSENPDPGEPRLNTITTERTKRTEKTFVISVLSVFSVVRMPCLKNKKPSVHHAYACGAVPVLL
jgi:hypothetical protein